MTITPDTKDWTWVLERPCAECGFDSQALDPTDVAPLLRADGHRWAEILHADGKRPRPAPEVWSPLEYSCHVRDVFQKFGVRLASMLTEDDPQFANWDQDAAAMEGRYGEQVPVVVAEELRQAADDLADAFAAVHGAQWQRPGRRSDDAKFTVASLARYLVHDEVHHLYDVTGIRYAASS